MSPSPSSSSVEALLSKRNFPLVRPSVARKGIKLFTGCRFSFPRPPPAGKIVGNCLAPKTSGTLSGGIVPIPCRGVYPRQGYRLDSITRPRFTGNRKERNSISRSMCLYPFRSHLNCSFFCSVVSPNSYFFLFRNECACTVLLCKMQRRRMGSLSRCIFFSFLLLFFRSYIQ